MSMRTIASGTIVMLAATGACLPSSAPAEGATSEPQGGSTKSDWADDGSGVTSTGAETGETDPATTSSSEPSDSDGNSSSDSTGSGWPPQECEGVLNTLDSPAPCEDSQLGEKVCNAAVLEPDRVLAFILRREIHSDADEDALHAKCLLQAFEHFGIEPPAELPLDDYFITETTYGDIEPILHYEIITEWRPDCWGECEEVCREKELASCVEDVFCKVLSGQMHSTTGSCWLPSAPARCMGAMSGCDTALTNEVDPDGTCWLMPHSCELGGGWEDGEVLCMDTLGDPDCP